MITSFFLLASFSVQVPQHTAPVELPVSQTCETQLEREKTAHAATRAEYEHLKLRLAQLEQELARVEEDRVAREREWLGYTRAISGLSNSVIPVEVVFRSTLQEEAVAQEKKKSVERLAQESRSHEAFITLRSLFVSEGIEGYDFLEAGLVEDGWTGPVVLRMLDQMRRPVGSLSAARLRLEGSQSSHTLTLIFEEGYERRGGRKIPFEGGSLQDLTGAVRRIVLPSVDPGPWQEALPELFGEAQDAGPIDDGTWDLTVVQLRLNELLREDAAAGHYRLRSIGGIRDSVFQAVHLEQRDSEGHIIRRLFADKLTLEVLDQGVWITLLGGAQIRGDEKLPFLGGRYRIFLPGARIDAWRDGRLPGLAPRKERSQ